MIATVGSVTSVPRDLDCSIEGGLLLLLSYVCVVVKLRK